MPRAKKQTVAQQLFDAAGHPVTMSVVVPAPRKRKAATAAASPAASTRKPAGKIPRSILNKIAGANDRLSEVAAFFAAQAQAQA